MAETAAPVVTRDAFFGGRLVLAQPAKGHRAGTDAVLLAAAAPHGFQGHGLDMGAGTGIVGLAIARQCLNARVTLVENNATCAALAQTNIDDNELSDRVRVAACDLLSREARRAAGIQAADLVVTNPPFYRSDRVRVSPNADRGAAHVMTATLDEWLVACLACLTAKGVFVMIHDAAAAADILRALDGRLGALTLLPVHPRAGEGAVRVLVRGIKGSRAPFRIAAPLVLHDGDRFTETAAALHAGSAALDW